MPSIQLSKKLSKIKFIRYGFLQNTWVSFHIFLAAIAIKFLSLTSLSKLCILSIVLLTAIIWEKIEEQIETPTKQAKIDLYGSYEKYWYDTIGDIVAALIISGIMLV